MGGYAVKTLRDVSLADEIHDFTKRENIGTRVRVFSFDDFRSIELHLLHKKLTIFAEIHFGHADIDDFRTAIPVGNQNVIRHYVTVIDTTLMHVMQALANFNQDTFHLSFRKRSNADMFCQCRAFDIFENYAIAQAFDLDKIKCPANIFVFKLTGGVILLSQCSLAALIACKCGF